MQSIAKDNPNLREQLYFDSAFSSLMQVVSECVCVCACFHTCTSEPSLPLVRTTDGAIYRSYSLFKKDNCKTWICFKILTYFDESKTTQNTQELRQDEYSQGFGLVFITLVQARFEVGSGDLYPRPPLSIKITFNVVSVWHGQCSLGKWKRSGVRTLQN